MDRNHGGAGVGRGSRGMVPGATVPTGQVVVVEESLAWMTSHRVSLLFTDPHQDTERMSKPASSDFTRSSSCSENNFHSEKG